MEYSRTLNTSASTGSLHARNNHSERKLALSPSADNLHKASMGRPLLGSPGPALSSFNAQNGVKSLGQSISMTSLLSVESDSSAPAPVAPPRSAHFNTGEVLQPVHIAAAGAGMQVRPAQTASNRGPIMQPPQRSPSNSLPPRVAHHIAQSGQQASMGMAVVHSQAAISRERDNTPQVLPQEPPQVTDNTQSTWVIEEVIDFGVPLDEVLVRECDDSGYPLGCKSLSVGPSQRGNFNLFDGCVHNVCYDEDSDMHGGRQDSGSELC